MPLLCSLKAEFSQFSAFLTLRNDESWDYNPEKWRDNKGGNLSNKYLVGPEKYDRNIKRICVELEGLTS